MSPNERLLCLSKYLENPVDEKEKATTLDQQHAHKVRKPPRESEALKCGRSERSKQATQGFPVSKKNTTVPKISNDREGAELSLNMETLLQGTSREVW